MISDAFAYCETLVREADKDRYLATLFAPAPARPHLYALYAFNAEVARVREVVSDPLPGEVRLQWWRDALAGSAHGDVAAHPVAAALIETISRCRLPVGPFFDLIEARVFDLYDDPMPTLADLEGYTGETSAALLQLAALILAAGRDPDTAEIAGHGGVAYAITGLLRAFPLHASRGQLFVPVDVLDRHGVDRAEVLRGRYTPSLKAALAEMRHHAHDHLTKVSAAVERIPAEVTAAFLPVALVRGYLVRMERGDYDPFTTPVQVPQWQRQLTLWWAARQARRIARPSGDTVSGPGTAL
ncbi:phytoene/squalene synthase family protein [Blastochloris viridis]|uniref:Phytoene synthase n=1 Tax=Blastochloris viridis TaxID=1079 RepID=A0A0H5BEX0_BLAVI|nr:phytoene/squalene synthase family protein [Blastochloris viridis]ALK09346.1 All-trans-phytoene synthase [Blastochloris viridis]BAS00776.1 phytoene synthase [Blastochloris viridis]CUU42009.1 squalene synthase HpnD [Blastochloris viridis]